MSRETTQGSSESAAADVAAHATQRLLAGFEAFGSTDLFAQVQRASGLMPAGLLGSAAVSTESLIALMERDFAGVGTLEQTRLIAGPKNYILEDTRFGLRLATGVSPSEETASDVYTRFCRQVQVQAETLLRDLREGEKLFVHTAGAAETDQSLRRLHRAMSRHGGATLLVVQPSREADMAGKLAWLAPGLMRGWLAPETTLDAWIAMCRGAAEMRQAAGSQVSTITAPSARVRLGVCAIIRDEADYVEEWITFHRAQGVDTFRIYDNGSIDGTPHILERLGIEPVIWAGQPDDFVAMQQAAYDEAARILEGKVDWLAAFDVDEFMYGHGRTLAEELADFPAQVSAIAVQQRLFGSGGNIRKSPGLVIQRFTRCTSWDHRENHWFKTIARPERIERFESPHSVVLRSGEYVMVDGMPFRCGDHPAWADRRADGNIRLNHYILKSYEEFQAKKARWTSRPPGPIVNDDFFRAYEQFTNEEVSAELAIFVRSHPDLMRLAHKSKGMEILFVQTADPNEYKEMLDLTSTINIKYCGLFGYRYENYVGVKIGNSAMHATYNRIFILHELMMRGYRGWVCYMDADAFVSDFLFDIKDYILSSLPYCFIACTGGSQTPWDLNAGVFFLNLADPDGRALARDWLIRFEALVPDSFLASPDATWGTGIPDDQQLLYEVLKNNDNLLAKTKKEEDGNLFNYRTGRFIKQATRESFLNMQQRLDFIRAETIRILENAKSIMPPSGKQAA